MFANEQASSSQSEDMLQSIFQVEVEGGEEGAQGGELAPLGVMLMMPPTSVPFPMEW
jgi:hypothetical protein